MWLLGNMTGSKVLPWQPSLQEDNNNDSEGFIGMETIYYIFAPFTVCRCITTVFISAL